MFLPPPRPGPPPPEDEGGFSWSIKIPIRANWLKRFFKYLKGVLGR